MSFINSASEKSNFADFLAMYLCTEKYMRNNKDRACCWSTYGAQLLCVQAFTFLWLSAPFIVLATFIGWLLNVDSLHICIVKIWTYFLSYQFPRVVQLGILMVNLWTIFCSMVYVLSNLTRLLLYACVTAFWLRMAAQEESVRFEHFLNMHFF